MVLGPLFLVFLLATAAGAQDEDSVETVGSILVDAPPPIPPPALLDADPRVRRARSLLVRVEVFDTTAARLARQLGRLLDAEATECEPAGAVSRALDLVVVASSAALDTIISGLRVLPADPQLDGLRDHAAQAQRRRVDALVDRAALKGRQASSCPDTLAAPTPWLPLAERTSVDGRVVLFLHSLPGTVTWVGGHPAGAGADDGWSAVVARAGETQVCAAAPTAEACQDRAEVVATMAAAFDLTALKD